MATAQNGQMKTDWDNFFASTPAGQAVSWGGGMLQNLGNGRAYLSSGDVTNGGMYFDQADINNPDKLSYLAAQSQGVANEWAKYGITPNQEQANYAARDRAARVASGQALPSIAVHGSDFDQNAAYFAANKNDPIAQYVREQSQGQNKYHTNTDWAGQYNLDPATGGSAGIQLGAAANSREPTAQMNADFANYWATTNPGDSQRFGAGTLFRNADGSALYTNSAGVGSVINSTDSIQGIASSNPEIAQAWRDQYGYGGTPSATLPQQPTYQQPNYQQPNYQQPNYPQPTAPQNEYQMPVLNALYQGQQQRMAAPAPQFNFQAKGPLTATSGAPQSQGVATGEPAPGALTTVINGG